MKKIDISQMAVIGVMTAVLCVLAPITLPIGLVPLSLANFVIFISVYVLGIWKGTVSCILYLLIGLIGVPVFSGFSSGPAKLLGPTGGYLIGYVFMALIAGFFIDRFKCRKLPSLLGMLLGTLVLYLLGTVWLAYQAGMTFMAALWAGVIPFIAGDLAKIIIALFLGPILRERLQKAGLYK
ncbi:MAG TPA: biotin transporter BioY [Lachnospiraceae bacterium]|nr:biotin transporter BioY [Lachnospiraceae bacterium]